jgi:hypothetical protein
MKRVPIAEAKRLAKRLGMRASVLVLLEPNGQQHVVTYGCNYDECVWAAEIGNQTKYRVLHWPLALCQSKPARQLRKTAALESTKEAK